MSCPLTPSPRKKQVLVTGADGQLGSELKRLLKQNPLKFDASFAGRHDLDIADKKAVENFFARHRDFDFVINCAAYTAVDKAETDIENCNKVNIAGVTNIVDAIIGSSTRLIQISSDYVFDGCKTLPYTEADAINPLSVYGSSKAKAEQIILDNVPEAVIIRTGWLYSSYGNNFVKTILKKARESAELKVVADQTGTPTYAADLADMILTAMTHNLDIPGGIYNFSNEGTATWYDFAKAIAELSGSTCVITPCSTAEYKTAANRPTYSVLDKTKTKQTLGIEIPTWRDSLSRCLAEIRKQEEQCQR